MDATLQSSARIYAGGQITTLARLVKADGSLLSSSDLTSIRLQVFETGTDQTGAVVIGAASAKGITIANSTVTEALVTANGWSADRSGYNFSHTYDIESFLTKGHYRAEYRLKTALLGDMFIIVDIYIIPTGQAAS